MIFYGVNYDLFGSLIQEIARHE